MGCNLVDGWGVGIQVALGLLAFSSLALKRWCESPRRPLKIWLFDASKQALANSLVHVVNVFSSNVLSKDTSDNDPCTWSVGVRAPRRCPVALFPTLQSLCFFPPPSQSPSAPLNPWICSDRYFINVCVDSTLGLAIIYGLIKLTSRIIRKKRHAPRPRLTRTLGVVASSATRVTKR